MALLTVGTGQTYASITAALAASSNPADEIVVRSNIDDEVSINKNIAAIYSDNNSTWNASTGVTLSVTNSLTQTLIIRDIKITHTSTANEVFYWVSVGTGSKIHFLRCDIRGGRLAGGGPTKAIIRATNTLSTVDQFIIEKCFITSDPKTSDTIDLGGNSFAGSVLIKNNILMGQLTGAAAVRSTANTTNIVPKIYNNTIYSHTEGFRLPCRSDCRNNLFMNNTSDIILVNNGLKTDHENCAFGTQTNDGGWPASTIFGVVTADTVVNTSVEDFNVKPLAVTIGGGQIISSVIDDWNGGVRPRGTGTGYDIGATQSQRFILT